MKRSILITVGVAALILLLGGAGFVGGRLLFVVACRNFDKAASSGTMQQQ